MQRSNNYWLDLFTFRSFLLPSIVPVVWIIHSIVLIFFLFNTRSASLSDKLDKIIASLVMLLATRFLYEFVIVSFKTHEEMVKLNNRNE